MTARNAWVASWRMARVVGQGADALSLSGRWLLLKRRFGAQALVCHAARCAL